MKKDKHKLGHLPTLDDQTEYVIPVRVTGTRSMRVKAHSLKEAVKLAEEFAMAGLQGPSSSSYGLTAEAMAPRLMLTPEERASWPYWAYGWYGTDGTDWRQYQTDQGVQAIPGVAEESWPIPPFHGDSPDGIED